MNWWINQQIMLRSVQCSICDTKFRAVAVRYCSHGSVARLVASGSNSAHPVSDTSQFRVHKIAFLEHGHMICPAVAGPSPRHCEEDYAAKAERGSSHSSFDISQHRVNTEKLAVDQIKLQCTMCMSSGWLVILAIVFRRHAFGDLLSWTTAMWPLALSIGGCMSLSM